MTGNCKRMGAAIAASALINLLFLISITLASNGTPLELPGMNRTSPLRVGLLPSVRGAVRLPGESSGAPEDSPPPEVPEDTSDAERAEKILEREPLPQTSTGPENSPAAAQEGTKKAGADPEGLGESSVDTISPPDQAEPGSETLKETFQDLRARFLIYLQHEIAVRQEYPFRARRRGTEGTVVLSLQVLADGSLRSYKVEQSSGSSTLDRAAEKLVTSIFPSPRIPGKDISCTVAVEYRLN